MRPRYKIAIACLPLIVAYHTISFKDAEELSDFSSDGCSLFPDGSIIHANDWCECCLEHDIAYWQGGTSTDRLVADQALRECVMEKTGDAELSRAMYIGVRLGGSPYFKNWYRWGYGWSYERKYRALSEHEADLVARKLNTFFRSDPKLPCD